MTELEAPATLQLYPSDLCFTLSPLVKSGICRTSLGSWPTFCSLPGEPSVATLQWLEIQTDSDHFWPKVRLSSFQPAILQEFSLNPIPHFLYLFVVFHSVSLVSWGCLCRVSSCRACGLTRTPFCIYRSRQWTSRNPAFLYIGLSMFCSKTNLRRVFDRAVTVMPQREEFHPDVDCGTSKGNSQ